MLKLWEETGLQSWRRASLWCAKRAFCCVCGGEQKQVHCSHFMAHSSGVPKPSSKSRGGVWLQSWHGSYHSLWRSCFQVSNISHQIINRPGQGLFNGNITKIMKPLIAFYGGDSWGVVFRIRGVVLIDLVDITYWQIFLLSFSSKLISVYVVFLASDAFCVNWKKLIQMKRFIAFTCLMKKV